jgi:hypothetical protein
VTGAGLSGTVRGDRLTKGRRMDEAPAIDEAFLGRYRVLLDAEDAAFDALEHAYEDGDRSNFERDLGQWRTLVERRHSFLERHGFAPIPTP